MQVRLVLTLALSAALTAPLTATPAGAAAPVLVQASAPAGTAAPRGVDDSCPEGSYPDDGFVDVPAENVHENAIDCLVWWRIANGRNSAYYAPGSGVARDAMASFIARAMGLDLGQPVEDAFSDDGASVHQQAINHLAAAGVVSGTGSGRYSPGRIVTRGQMARFIANAARVQTGAELPATQDFFDDDAGHVFETDINRVAEAGVAGGRSGRTYGPDGTVSRDAMASFQVRMLDLFVEVGAREAPAAESTPRNPGDDLDCGDFAARPHAQSWYEHYQPHYGDVAQLDPEGDRLACDGPTGCPTQLSGSVAAPTAARCLYEAWAFGERDLVGQYASQSAEDWMFQYQYSPPDWEWYDCAPVEELGGQVVCSWYIPDPDPRYHGVGVDMFMETDALGYYVSYIESYG